MDFQRVSDLKAPDGHAIPGFLFVPDSPRGGAVVCPGYGSSKEQMLGIATAVAEKGIAVLAVDLCGHGENMAPIGPAMRDEMEAAIAFVRRFGRTAVIGHSLGGRLALMSSADVMVAMSPSVMMQMSPQGKWMFENLPSPGLREPYSGYVLELLEKLGPVPLARPPLSPPLLRAGHSGSSRRRREPAGRALRLREAPRLRGHPPRRAARERPDPLSPALVQPQRAAIQPPGLRDAQRLARRSPRESLRRSRFARIVC